MKDGDRVVGVVAEGPEGRVDLAADLVVACDGLRSPTRDMAGLETEFDALPEAELGFMSPRRGDLVRHEVHVDGGHIGMLSWNEGRPGGGAASAPAATPRSPRHRRDQGDVARLLPAAASAIEGVSSEDQIRYTEPVLLRCPRWWVPAS